MRRSLIILISACAATAAISGVLSYNYFSNNDASVKTAAASTAANENKIVPQHDNEAVFDELKSVKIENTRLKNELAKKQAEFEYLQKRLLQTTK